MDRLPRASVEIRDFPGLVNNGDPSDLPPGAAIEQVNVTSQTPGELAVRRGYRDVRFEAGVS